MRPDGTPVAVGGSLETERLVEGVGGFSFGAEATGQLQPLTAASLGELQDSSDKQASDALAAVGSADDERGEAANRPSVGQRARDRQRGESDHSTFVHRDEHKFFRAA